MIMVDFNGEEQIIASEHLYQWDTGQAIYIEFDSGEVVNSDNLMVHFANKYSEQAMVVTPYSSGTSSETHRHFVWVIIPNTLLETASPIVAYIHNSIGQEVQKTIKMVTILVEPRKKPEDYISEQEYTYTLEALRAEVRKWLDELDSEREADYQNFKNQIKDDVKNMIIEQTKPDMTEYEYISDTKVKYNGVTYTVTKDSTTGLIKSVTTNNGDTITPTINSGITDTTLHNAVFWATAMSACTKEISFTGMSIIPNVIVSTSII